MALNWSQVEGFKLESLRRWAVWLEIPDAEAMPLRRLIEELFILGYLQEDRPPTAYF